MDIVGHKCDVCGIIIEDFHAVDGRMKLYLAKTITTGSGKYNDEKSCWQLRGYTKITGNVDICSFNCFVEYYSCHYPELKGK